MSIRSYSCSILLLLLTGATARPLAPDDSCTLVRQQIANCLSDKKTECKQAALADSCMSPTERKKVYAQACGMSEVSTCLSTADGVIYFSNVDDAPDALKINRLACEAGQEFACIALGYQESWDDRVPRNTMDAAVHFKIACDHGSSTGCIYLGRLYEPPRGLDYSYHKAASLYESQCNKGEQAACVSEGFLLQYGTNLEDYLRAIGLFKAACESGNALGCRYMAEMYCSGKGVEANCKTAREWYEKACKLGDPVSCHEIASRDWLSRFSEWLHELF
jgi:TPR repeat protein